MCKKLILASGSPRRLEILRAAGIEPEVLVVDVLELTADRPPCDLVIANARLKAEAAAKLKPQSLILAADTVVALGGRIFGKPKDAADAAHMLNELSGRTHSVFTGVAVYQNGSITCGAAETKVTFRQLDDAEITAYVATGEPMDKAGAYAVQGGAGRFVQQLDGDLDNVIGLPMRLVSGMISLAEFVESKNA